MSSNDLINITLIGDIFPGELPFTRDYGIRTQFKIHKGALWGLKIKEILGSNDIVIGNLESPLVTNGNSVKNTFYGDPGFALFLKECGINVLNIANNHILEQGYNAFRNTIDTLNKVEIGVVGNNTDSGSNIYYIENKDLKVAIAGFSNVDLQVIENNGSFSILNENDVIHTLKIMMEEKADLKILSFHWGNEYVRIPSLEQRKIAYKFIDHGADVIAGHHPHVIQPYEKYKNGHIFYSLGNFIFDYIHSEMVSIGLVARIDVNARNKNVNVKLKGVKLSNKDTIEVLPDHSFKKYYSDITNLYEKTCKMADEDYINHYKNLLRRNHLGQRISMKTAIIKEFFRVNGNSKTILIQNLLKYYFK